jgi:hypothetical protein
VSSSVTTKTVSSTRQQEIDEENKPFKVSGKQHVSFEVILVHNAMESFQQKVPPILLGAFEDIFH